MEFLRDKSGVLLTDEVTDEIAREAEDGYDLSDAKLIPVGRPSLNGSGVSRLIQVRVDDALDEQLRALAEAQERTLSAVVRDAIRQYVASDS